jgi:hypothetical protein
MDVTDGESLDWMRRGYVEAANTDGDGVSVTGDSGNLPDDVNRILADLLADHDVDRYPGGAVIGWFPTGNIDGLHLRDPEEVDTDPYPFDSV